MFCEGSCFRVKILENLVGRLKNLWANNTTLDILYLLKYIFKKLLVAPITLIINSLAGWIFNPHGSVQYTLLSLTDTPKQTINLSDFKIT